MYKAIKILVIVILAQISVVLAGWMYQKATGNKISNHLKDLSKWYNNREYRREMAKYEQAREEYEQAREKWWNDLTPEQKNDYQREMDEIEENCNKLYSEGKKKYEECMAQNLPSDMFKRIQKLTSVKSLCADISGLTSLDLREESCPFHLYPHLAEQKKKIMLKFNEPQPQFF